MASARLSGWDVHGVWEALGEKERQEAEFV